jgi:hypothetical protein
VASIFIGLGCQAGWQAFLLLWMHETSASVQLVSVQFAADQPVQTVRVTIQLKGLLRIAQKVSQLCDVRMDSIMISALLC